MSGRVRYKKLGQNTLAIHSVCHSTMAWDAIAKVFDVKRSFESRCKEALRMERPAMQRRQGGGCEVDTERKKWFSRECPIYQMT
jgi:hypothetical protein